MNTNNATSTTPWALSHRGGIRRMFVVVALTIWAPVNDKTTWTLVPLTLSAPPAGMTGAGRGGGGTHGKLAHGVIPSIQGEEGR